MSQKINVDIITEYKGRQNLKTAQNDMGGLGQAAKKLGEIVAATFATEKIIEFGKASVEAFAADQKSAAILSNTLVNLGLAFTDIPVEKFIKNLSELNGIAKTDLRDSFSTLVRSTKDSAKAQDLLSLGLDISAGTGKDLASVTKALAKAYGGSYTALSKLGAGLSKAEIATGNFAEIQKHLAQVFNGDAAVAADTVSGRINRLKTSFEEFKITIGAGLVDALSALGKDANLAALQTTMDHVATDIADMVRGIGVFGGYLTNIVKNVNGLSGGILGKILGFAFNGSIAGLLKSTGEKSRKASEEAQAKTTATTAAKTATATQKSANTLLATQKSITAEKTKQLKADQAALSLKLAGSTTDMQNIEIQAALQRSQSTEVQNVLLLQRAILNGNADQANILAQEVLRANGLVMDVSGNISSLAGAKDPFKDWPAASSAAVAQLKAIQDALDKLQDKTITITVNTVSTGSNGVAGLIPMPSDNSAVSNIGNGASTLGDYLAGVANNGLYANPGSGVSTIGDYLSKANVNNMYSNPGSGISTPGSSTAPVAVTVVLNGQTVGNAITSAQVDQSASGINSTFQRNYGSGSLPW
jgi:hypothetical protein